MNRKNTFGIKLTYFGNKFLLLGISLLFLLFLIANLLPEIINDAIFSEIFMFTVASYILLYVGVKVYEERKKLKDKQITKNQLISKYIIFGSLILFVILIFGYHKTGPRGATNNCYDDFKFVSCEKQTSTSIYGNNVYTCLRDGKKSLVNCNASECNAVCER